jgi:hypothetical protein
LSGWPRPTPANAGWQRDLSVSYEKVGNVLVEQGDLTGGRCKPTATASPSLSAWPRPTPAMPAGGDLSVSYDKVGTVLVAQGDLTAALQAYREG